MSDRRNGPTRQVLLNLEQVEDRLTPATAFDPYRVLFQAPVATPTATVIEQVRQVRGTAGVEPLGAGLYRVKLGPGFTIQSAQLQLPKLNGISQVQPDYKVQLNQLPSDPRIGEQWGLRNTTSPNADINASQAWTVSTGTRQTIVAVLDTGVDYTHPDLAANMWVNPREVPGNNADDDGNGFVDDIHGYNFMENNGNPMDDLHHGTHVAGIIGAVGNNGIGISGVNQNTRIMALRFIGANGGGFTSDAVRAINYAVANGAKVINTSWGGAPYDNALVTAIQSARNAGVIIVGSAGNDGNNVDINPFYPGSYSTVSDNVISVAATTITDQIPSYSNFGANSVLLAAPGDNILSTFPNNGYSYLSGTSMAAPFVTGAISLLRDVRPDWSYQQVIAKLRTSVDTLPSLAGKTVTGGRLDLAKLLDAPAVAPPPVTPPVTPPPPPAPTGDTTPPRVLSAAFSGPRTGTIDRLTLNFSEAMNVNTLASGITVSGPGGKIGISAMLPVAGSNNSRFTLMLSRAQTASGRYQVVVGTVVTDVSGNKLDQNNNGIGGQTADTFTLSTTLGTPTSPPVVPPTPPVVPPPPTTSTAPRVNYSVLGGAKAIQDRRTTRVEFMVTQNTKVTDITLSLNISHARTTDLNMRLIAPDGRVVTLFNRRAGSNLTNTTFDDKATKTLAQASGPFTGSVKPEQALGLFAGANTQGLWVLQIFDLADGTSGTLNSATLSIGLTNTAANVSSSLNVAPPLQDALTKGRPDQIALS